MKFSIWEMLLATAMGIMIGCAIQWGPLDDSEEQPTAVKQEASGVVGITNGIKRVVDEGMGNVCYAYYDKAISCVSIIKPK